MTLLPPMIHLKGCPWCGGDTFLDAFTYPGAFVCSMCARPETNQDPTKKIIEGEKPNGKRTRTQRSQARDGYDALCRSELVDAKGHSEG